MKKFISALLLLVASQMVAAGPVDIRVVDDNLKSSDLDGKINDLITEKFTNKYPHDKWTINIMSTTGNSISDNSALFYVSVGVAPKGVAGVQPARKVWETISHDPNVINVSPKNKKPLVVEYVRRMVRNMMNECEKSPNCDIDK